MKYITRYDFFKALGSLTITEIRDELLSHSQNNSTKYTEIINDFECYIDTLIGIGPDIATAKTKDEFKDLKAKELTPFAPDEIWHYENIELEPPYKLVFDFITIEPNNSVKVSQLKVSYSWDKGYVSRSDYEKERERIAVFVHRAFKFREACKMAIVELLEQPQPEAVNLSKDEQQPPKHPQIFKGDAFEIWQSMFDEFKITKRSRTDIDFMFEVMKYEGLIYDNIRLIDIQNWINDTYGISFEKIKYTDPKQSSNEKRMIAYNLINPK